MPRYKSQRSLLLFLNGEQEKLRIEVARLLHNLEGKVLHLFLHALLFGSLKSVLAREKTLPRIFSKFLVQIEVSSASLSMKQQTLSQCSPEFNDYWKISGRRVHGGEYAKGKRKTARPFDRKRPIHVVMRSSRAKGTLALSSPRNRGKVKLIIESTAATCGLTIYRYSINSNHLHILVRPDYNFPVQLSPIISS